MARPLITGESESAKAYSGLAAYMTVVTNDVFELAKKLAVIGAFSVALAKTKRYTEAWIILSIAVYALKLLILFWASSQVIAQNYPRARRLLQKIELDQRLPRALVILFAVIIAFAAFWQFNNGFERMVNDIAVGWTASSK